MSEKIETGGPAYPHTLRGHPMADAMLKAREVKNGQG